MKRRLISIAAVIGICASLLSVLPQGASAAPERGPRQSADPILTVKIAPGDFRPAKWDGNRPNIVGLKIAPVYTAPTVVSGLTYNGSPQTLVKGGKVQSQGFTMTYAVQSGSDISDTAPDTGTFLSDVPERTNAGNYRVWWYIASGTISGTKTTPVGPNSIDVSIAKATPSYTTPANLTATCGQTLADVALPSAENGAWSWQDETTTSVGSAGTNQFQVTFTPTDTDNYNTVSDISASVTVSKPAPDYTAPTNVTAAICAKTASELVKKGSVSSAGCEMRYKVVSVSGDGTETQVSDWSAAVPTASSLAHGDYKVYWKVVGNETYDSVEADTQVLAVTVQKALPVYTAPSAATGLVYDGNAKTLVSGGSVTTSGCTMTYAVLSGNDISDTAPDTGTFTSDIPQQTNAGSYRVWWYIAETEHTCAIGPNDIDVTIAEPVPSPAAPAGGSSSGGSSSGGSSSGGSSSDKSKTYRVTFHANNGSADKTVRVEEYTTVQEPLSPTKEGYTFGGWYTDSDLAVEYDFSSRVTSSFTLYAKWTEKKGPPEEPSAPEEPETGEPAPSEPPAEDPFQDISESDWFYEDVMKAYRNGLASGVGGREFAPYIDTTRGMFVTILYRMEGEPETDFGYTFEDVPKDEYYTEAVAWAGENQIVKGFSDEIFAPYQTITREQMATILYRYAGYSGLDTSFDGGLTYTDSGEISDFALGAVKWATANRIMIGVGGNAFAPKNNASRAEVTTVLERFYEKFKE